MAPTMRFAAVLAALTGAAADGSVWDKVKKYGNMQKEDVVKVDELIAFSPINAESCGLDSDLMQVKSVHFDASARAAVVRGSLMQPVSGGKVIAKIDMVNLPEDLGLLARAKGNLMWAVSGEKFHEEELCAHFDRYSGMLHDSCPVPAGEDQELRFAFAKLPQMVMAGNYNLQFISVDPVGNQIACVKGSLTIAPGKEGQMFRKLDDHEAMAASNSVTTKVSMLTTALAAVAGLVSARL